MRFKILVFLFVLLSTGVNMYAQNVTIDKKKAKIIRILETINDQTGYQFIYSENLLDKLDKITINARNENISDVLKKCLKDSRLEFEIKNRTIIIRASKSQPHHYINTQRKQTSKPDLILMQGKVAEDSTNAPIAGANIMIKGTMKGCISDKEGNYQILAQPGNTLIFSYIGYETLMHDCDEPEELNIRLKAKTAIMDAVVMIGYGNQNRKDLTGSIAEVPIED